LKTYRIAGIDLLISFHYEEYFKDNIEKYETKVDSNPKYQIESFLVDEIKEPVEAPIKDRNPYICRGKELSYLYIKNTHHQVKAMFTHDRDFLHSKIYINENILENPDEIEYVFMSMIFMEIAAREGFFSLHASAIQYHNEIILISAPSQTGKSTHANYWLKAFDHIHIINDDKPLIKCINEKLIVFGTPFSGKNKLNVNTHAPLKAITFYSQGLDNKIKKLDNDEIRLELLKNMHRPMEADLWDIAVTIIDELIDKIPFYRIYATHSIESAITLKNMIYQGDKHEN